MKTNNEETKRNKIMSTSSTVFETQMTLKERGKLERKRKQYLKCFRFKLPPMFSHIC